MLIPAASKASWTQRGMGCLPSLGDAGKCVLKNLKTKVENSPFKIADRILSTSPIMYATLCWVKSCTARGLEDFRRACNLPLETFRVQAWQGQSGSITESVCKANSCCFSFICPASTKATPNRAVLVGYTQSYWSTPKAVQTTKSKGYPTPIKYRGRSSGKCRQAWSTTLQKSSLLSPPARPPIANPGIRRWPSFLPSSDELPARSRWRNPAKQSSRSPPLETSKWPCMMGNKFWVDGFTWAFKYLSYYCRVRNVVSWNRFLFIDVFEMTLFSCMIILVLISFW